jgi:hypothetical protein
MLFAARALPPTSLLGDADGRCQQDARMSRIRRLDHVGISLAERIG